MPFRIPGQVVVVGFLFLSNFAKQYIRIIRNKDQVYDQQVVTLVLKRKFFMFIFFLLVIGFMLLLQFPVMLGHKSNKVITILLVMKTRMGDQFIDLQQIVQVKPQALYKNEKGQYYG